MSLVTFVRDYVQDPNRIIHIPNFVFDACKESLWYIFSFQWFRNLTYITLNSPSFTENSYLQNANSLFGIKNIDLSSLTSGFNQIQELGSTTPYFGQSSLLNHVVYGFVNGITSTFSFCAISIVIFHILLNENKNRAFKMTLIGCFGEVSYMAFIIFGFQSLIIPWLTLEPLSYILSLTIQLFFALAIIKDNRKIKATIARAIPYGDTKFKGLSSKGDKNKFGTSFVSAQSGQLSHNFWIIPSLFLFSWCERGGVFQNLASLGIQPSGSYLQTPLLALRNGFTGLQNTVTNGHSAFFPWTEKSNTFSWLGDGGNEVQLQIFVYLLGFIVTRIGFSWIILSISESLIEWKDNTNFSFRGIKDRLTSLVQSIKEIAGKTKDLGLLNVLNEIFTGSINLLFFTLHRVGNKLNINPVRSVRSVRSRNSGNIFSFLFFWTYRVKSNRGDNQESVLFDYGKQSSSNKAALESRFVRQVPLKNILRDPIAIAAVTCSLAFLPAYSTNLLITKSVGFFPEENRTSHSFFSPWDMPGEVLGNDMDHISNRNNENNFPEYSFFLPFYDKGDYGGWLGLGEEDVRYEPFYLWRSRRIRAPWRKTNLQEPASIFTNDKSLFTNPNLNLQQKETTNIKPGLSLFTNSSRQVIQNNGVMSPALSPKLLAHPKGESVVGETKRSPSHSLLVDHKEDVALRVLREKKKLQESHEQKQENKVEKDNKYAFLRTRLTEPVLMRFSSGNLLSSHDAKQRTSSSWPLILEADQKVNNKNNFRISKEGRKKLVENFKKPERAKTQVIKDLKKDKGFSGMSPFSLFFARTKLAKPTEDAKSFSLSSKLPTSEAKSLPLTTHEKEKDSNSTRPSYTFGDKKQNKVARIRAISKRVKEFKLLKRKFQFLKVKDRKKSLKKSSQSVHLKYLKVKKKKRQKLGKYIPKLRRQYPYIRNVKERKLSLFGFYLPTFEQNSNSSLLAANHAVSPEVSVGRSENFLSQGPAEWNKKQNNQKDILEIYKEKNKPFYWKGYPKKKDSINYKEDLNLVFRSQVGEDLDFAQEEIQARIFLNPYIRFLLNFRVDNFLSREKFAYNSYSLLSPSAGETKSKNFLSPSHESPSHESPITKSLSPSVTQTPTPTHPFRFARETPISETPTAGSGSPTVIGKHNKQELPTSNQILLSDKRKANQPLTLKGEQDLFKRRLIISKYADTVNFLKPTLNHSYTDRIYNHQFKGTLSTARRLFSLKVKYDQSLVHSLDYKPAIENEDLIFTAPSRLSPLHTVLSPIGVGDNNFKIQNLNNLFEKSCLAPLYVAWEPESRKLIYTNRYLNYENTFSSKDHQQFTNWPLNESYFKNNEFFFSQLYSNSQPIDSYLSQENEKARPIALPRRVTSLNTVLNSKNKGQPTDAQNSQKFLKLEKNDKKVFLFKHFWNPTMNSSLKESPFTLRSNSLSPITKSLSPSVTQTQTPTPLAFTESSAHDYQGQQDTLINKKGNIQKVASNGYYLPASAEQQKITGVEEREYPLWMVLRTLPPNQGGFLWPGD